MSELGAVLGLVDGQGAGPQRFLRVWSGASGGTGRHAGDSVWGRRVSVITGGSRDPVSGGAGLVTLLFVKFGVKGRP